MTPIVSAPAEGRRKRPTVSTELSALASGRVGGAWILVGLLMMLFPTLDLVLAVLPFDPGEVTWRFGAVGLLSRTLLTPLVGALFVLVGGLAVGAAWIGRATGALLFLSALVLVGLTVLFGFDALQMRGYALSDTRRTFEVTSAGATVKLIVSAAAAAALGWIAWSTTSRAERVSRG